MKDDRATALVYRDNKILMIHRLRDGNEYYLLPGGHVEDGEQVERAVLRELAEETSIEATISKKLCTFIDEKARTHHIYVCEYFSGVPKLARESVERTRASQNNIYTPMWVEAEKISEILIWPKETKQYLADYLNVIV